MKDIFQTKYYFGAYLAHSYKYNNYNSNYSIYTGNVYYSCYLGVNYMYVKNDKVIGGIIGDNLPVRYIFKDKHHIERVIYSL